MQRFLQQISNEFSIDGDILKCRWETYDTANTKYVKMKKPELVSLCKEMGFMSVGTKPELIGYIFDKTPEEVKVVKEKVVKVKVVKVKVDKAAVRETMIDKLKKQAPLTVIKRNKWGHFEHGDTGFLFDKKTRRVFGKQVDDGSVSHLSIDDIEKCRQFSFGFDIPDNLDKKGGGVVVDGKIEGDDSDIELDDSESDEEDEELME